MAPLWQHSPLWQDNGPRYFSKVKVGSKSDCWPWLGAISAHHGEGIFRFLVDGKPKPTAHHVVSYVLFKGFFGKNKRVEALCKNKLCCNPDHLYLAPKQGPMKRCEPISYDEKVLKKFWDNVEKKAEDECWLYRFLDVRGYGRIDHTTNGRTITEGAHRYIFFKLNPETDENAFICHHCDTPACVNPKHLYAGNPATNAKDRALRGRNDDRRGEKAPRAKLKDDDVRKILRMYAAGDATMRSLALFYGVSQSCINLIVRRVNWRHITF